MDDAQSGQEEGQAILVSPKVE